MKKVFKIRIYEEICTMKIIPLKEGNFSTNKTKDFTLLTGENNATVKGIKMSITPFLIITEKDIIMLDAGIGWKNESGKTVISEILARENIKPESVTKVLLSHLHKDHIETTIVRTENGFEATFPNADIYIQKRELEYAMQNKNSHSFDFDTLEKLISLDQIVWMDEDSGSITDEIYFEVAGGHTPFMQVFWIKDGKETVFYGADDLPQESYLKYHLAYKSDFDGRKAMELRLKWQKEATENHWKILLYHDLDKAILQF
ncbi:Glyoxylase, beta-lactamase superfamily II [Chryseobacterium takakiae]|uniref:Glyoxylase, beta-lactamase superfamily II n=2 Tax=Chryseobacterium takakiae TaxID=1302685 RepID=A0A1M4SW17_9FLAO|nr:Glyoxylase, beta-lactamase superfamily II [Chryseobacterium takakiae]